MIKSIPNDFKVSRGEIWTADLGNENILPGEQQGYRPVIIIQNDMGNKYGPTVIVAAITSEDKHNLSVHMSIDLIKPSTILFEQIKTISKSRLYKYIRKATPKEMQEANRALKISLGLEA